MKTLQGVEVDDKKLILHFTKSGTTGNIKIWKSGKLIIKKDEADPSLHLFFGNADIVIRMEKAFNNLLILMNGKQKF